jgi:hypothetical protein
MSNIVFANFGVVNTSSALRFARQVKMSGLCPFNDLLRLMDFQVMTRWELANGGRQKHIVTGIVEEWKI